MSVISIIKEKRTASWCSVIKAIRWYLGIYKPGNSCISGSPGFQLITTGDVW